MAKLLLADDSVTIQRVIELTFADEHIQVIAVGDGQEAVQRIEADRPDVILADVGMPRRDGYEVAAHVKKSPHLKHIPVLLLTGAFEPIDEARARAVGCDGVLVKPFEPQMVINRVKDLLAGKRSASLWAEGASTPPTEAPAAPAPPEPPPLEPQPRPIDSLDEYFDRLDAAFAQHAPAGQPAALEPVPQPPPQHQPPPQQQQHSPSASTARPTDFGDWDLPAMSGARQPPEPAPAPAAAAPAARSVTPSPAGAPREPAAAAASVGTATLDAAASPAGDAAVPGTAEGPALADAFAALLAAEQALSTRPVAATAPASAPVTDDVVEEAVRRVIARMSDQVVRETVLQVAERMVRDEIDRLKKGAS
jgi:CheY-like chemotaxis protein